MPLSLLVILTVVSFVIGLFIIALCITDGKIHPILWPFVAIFIGGISWLSIFAFQPWVIESVEFAEIQEKNNIQYIVFNYGDEIGFLNITNLFNRVFKDETIAVETYSTGPYAGLYYDSYRFKVKTQWQSFLAPPYNNSAVRIINPTQVVPQIVPVTPEAPAEPEE